MYLYIYFYLFLPPGIYLFLPPWIYLYFIRIYVLCLAHANEIEADAGTLITNTVETVHIQCRHNRGSFTNIQIKSSFFFKKSSFFFKKSSFLWKKTHIIKKKRKFIYFWKITIFINFMYVLGISFQLFIKSHKKSEFAFFFFAKSWHPLFELFEKLKFLANYLSFFNLSFFRWAFLIWAFLIWAFFNLSFFIWAFWKAQIELKKAQFAFPRSCSLVPIFLV